LSLHRLAQPHDTARLLTPSVSIDLPVTEGPFGFSLFGAAS
jgi:hypothetical protein